MRWRFLACVVFLGLIAVFTDLHAQDAQFRSGVELVPVTVTVTDDRGRYVTDLGADDFSLLDNGVARRPEIFRRERAATAMAVILDSSASMSDRLPAVKDAVAGLLGSLDTGDSAAIVDCDSTATLLGSFTADRSMLEAALDRVTPGGTTSLYDAVLRATAELEGLASDGGIAGPRRGVIVVFSDGGDTSSTATVGQALAHAQKTGAVVYTIALRRDGAPRPRGIVALLEKHAAGVLHQLADTTGGRAFVAASASELSDVYTQIDEELTSQYMLGFSPSASDRPERHRIAVGVRRTGTVVRARAGYVTPGL